MLKKRKEKYSFVAYYVSLKFFLSDTHFCLFSKKHLIIAKFTQKDIIKIIISSDRRRFLVYVVIYTRVSSTYLKEKLLFSRNF